MFYDKAMSRVTARLAAHAASADVKGFKKAVKAEYPNAKFDESDSGYIRLSGKGVDRSV